MSKQEIKIITKIIRELSFFLMIHGHKDFQLETLNDPKTTTVFIRLKEPKEAFLKHMQEKLNREREMEVETYGWELLGDIDEQSDFAILGSLIDEMTYQKDKDDVIIKLVRTNRYLDDKK